MSVDFIRKDKVWEGSYKAEHTVKNSEKRSLQNAFVYAKTYSKPLLVEKNEWKMDLDTILLMAGENPEVNLQIVFPDDTKLTDSFLEYLTWNYVPASAESPEAGPYGLESPFCASASRSAKMLEMHSFCVEDRCQEFVGSIYQEDLVEDFATTLGRYINGRWTGRRNEFCDEIGRSRQAFNKIINGSDIPKRETVFAMIIALRLDIVEATDLLMKAGYAFNCSKLFDVVIKDAVVHGNYDRYAIDDKLAELGQKMLPGGVV